MMLDASFSTLVLFFLLLASLPGPSSAALTVGAGSADSLVRKLRQSIFIETAYLEERPDLTCSSLDGPSCVSASLLADSDPPTVLDRPGVLPDLLLYDLGANKLGAEFATPDYTVLKLLRRQREALGSLQAMPIMLAGDEEDNFLASARASVEAGILHLEGLQADRRVPLTFSQGLPDDLVATWDGRWIVRDCSYVSAGTLPIAGMGHKASPSPYPADHKLSVLVPSFGQGGEVVSPGIGETQQLSVVAELAGSLCYLRFSRPVAVRSLFVRWQPAEGAPPALIGGRLGLEGVWTRHLDPLILEKGRSNGWFDVGGGPSPLSR
ncbi:unnamed protein product [Polarella glacialis]|uniref:Phospholipase B-like n=1 Tax=Polarella glacialis TaxID=89957 RepID=A0A813K6L2_POLGL|nr:unnamed protein product [Polarella glacialis]